MFEGLTSYTASLELSLVIAFALLFLFGILAYTKKMSIGIAIAAAVAGFGVSWFASDYNRVIMQPFYNAIWFGYDWGFPAILGGLHFASIIFMVIVAGRNLYISEGEVIWA